MKNLKVFRPCNASSDNLSTIKSKVSKPLLQILYIPMLLLNHVSLIKTVKEDPYVKSFSKVRFLVLKWVVY